MNKKGLTVVELILAAGIVTLITMTVITLCSRQAHGAELNRPILANDAVVNGSARAMLADPDRTVTILIYSEVWTAGQAGYDRIDKLMNEYKSIIAKFAELGVSKQRVDLLLANKGGLIEDGTIAPTSDGVYIILN